MRHVGVCHVGVRDVVMSIAMIGVGRVTVGVRVVGVDRPDVTMSVIVGHIKMTVVRVSMSDISMVGVIRMRRIAVRIRVTIGVTVDVRHIRVIRVVSVAVGVRDIRVRRIAVRV